MIEIRDSAIFVADSHYPHHGDEFLDLLKRLSSGELSTPQLFLMGDIFDLLFGYSSYIREFSQDAISLLQGLSKDIDIYYFEGNHDFLLSDIFEDITIYSRQNQPQLFGLSGRVVALSHGDRYALSWSYDLYSFLIRNRLLIKILKPFEKIIIDDRMKRLSQKSICHKFERFDKRVSDILRVYRDVDLVIEGHYHQGRVIDNYISLPSLVCQHQIATISNNKIVFVDLDLLV